MDDAALIFQALAGHDASNPDSRDGPMPGDLMADWPVRAVCLAILHHVFIVGTDPEWTAATEQAIELLQEQGVVTEDITLLGLTPLGHTVNLIVALEAIAFNHHWFQQRPNDFGPILRHLIEAGRSHGVVAYGKAQKI